MARLGAVSRFFLSTTSLQHRSGKGLVPTISAPCIPPSAPFGYNGGALLHNAHVFAVFWGTHFSSAPTPSAGDIARAIGRIVSGSYMSALSQHGIGNAVLADAFIVDSPVGGSPADPGGPNFTDTNVQNFLYDLIGLNLLPQPMFTTDALYFVFLPPGITANPNAAGEHGALPFPKFPGEPGAGSLARE